MRKSPGQSRHHESSGTSLRALNHALIASPVAAKTLSSKIDNPGPLYGASMEGDAAAGNVTLQ